MCLYRCIGGTAGLAVLLGLALAPNTCQGDDKPIKAEKVKTAPETVRLVYPVAGGSAKELAEVLKPHFRQSSFLALAVTGSNKLLLSGTKEDVQDAVRLLRELDRPAQTIHVDVFLVEMTAKGAGSADLSGPMKKVATRLIELQQEGKVASVQRIEVSVLEGGTAKYLLGAYKPYVTGVTRLGSSGPFGGGGFGGSGASGVGGFGGGGRKGAAGKGGSKGDGGPGGAAGAGRLPGDDGSERIVPRSAAVSSTVSYRNLGTQVQISKPQITMDGLVELQIHIEDSQAGKASGGVELFSDEKGGGVPATEFSTFTFEDRLIIPRGHVVTAQTTQTSFRNTQGQKLILVGVRSD